MRTVIMQDFASLIYMYIKMMYEAICCGTITYQNPYSGEYSTQKLSKIKILYVVIGGILSCYLTINICTLALIRIFQMLLNIMITVEVAISSYNMQPIHVESKIRFVIGFCYGFYKARLLAYIAVFKQWCKSWLKRQIAECYIIH